MIRKGINRYKIRKRKQDLCTFARIFVSFFETKFCLKPYDKKDDSEQIIDSYYDLIQKDLWRKLKEFNYETNNLFPDFVDYLNYKSKEFKLPKKKKSKKVGLGNFKKIDESNKT